MYVAACVGYLFTFMNLASSSEFSSRDKKMSTTSFGSGIAGGDYLSTTLERRLSKDKSEALGMCI